MSGFSGDRILKVLNAPTNAEAGQSDCSCICFRTEIQVSLLQRNSDKDVCFTYKEK